MAEAALEHPDDTVREALYPVVGPHDAGRAGQGDPPPPRRTADAPAPSPVPPTADPARRLAPGRHRSVFGRTNGVGQACMPMPRGAYTAGVRRCRARHSGRGDCRFARISSRRVPMAWEASSYRRAFGAGVSRARPPGLRRPGGVPAKSVRAVRRTGLGAVRGARSPCASAGCRWRGSWQGPRG
jgi:hypothetical protein